MDVITQCFIDAKKAAMHDTWGHLGPTSGEHSLVIVFTYSVRGDIVIIDEQCNTLENNPWHFSNLMNLVDELTDEDDVVEGGVYRFEGSCTYGFEKEAVIDEFKDRYRDYDDEACWYADDSYAMIQALKTITGCHDAQSMLEKYDDNLAELHALMVSVGIDALEAISVITMTDWTGQVVQLVKPLEVS